MTSEQLQLEISKSTCQKRVTVCAIYDVEGRLLASGSNRCSPNGGTCKRLGVVQTKSEYDTESTCNWTHAEINAIGNLSVGVRPFKAVLWGHDFYCIPCETALKKVGIEVLEIAERKLENKQEALF